MDSSVNLQSHFDTVVAALDYRLADLIRWFKDKHDGFADRYVIRTIPSSHKEHVKYISQFSFDADYDRHRFDQAIAALMSLFAKLQINYSFLTTLTILLDEIEGLVAARQVVFNESARYKQKIKTPNVETIHFKEGTKTPDPNDVGYFDFFNVWTTNLSTEKKNEEQ